MPRTSSGSSRRCPNWATTCRTVPTAPSEINSRTRKVCGWSRNMKPSISVSPALRADSTALSAPAASSEKGFSQRTCLPASNALSVHSTCRELGSGM